MDIEDGEDERAGTIKSTNSRNKFNRKTKQTAMNSNRNYQ